MNAFSSATDTKVVEGDAAAKEKRTECEHGKKRPGISVQGRLRVGMHVVLRGREACTHFQTGGCSLRELIEVRLEAPDASWQLHRTMACGHVSLFRERGLSLGKWSSDNMHGFMLLRAMASAAEHCHRDMVQWLFGCEEVQSVIRECARTGGPVVVELLAALLRAGWEDLFIDLDEVVTSSSHPFNTHAESSAGGAAATRSEETMSVEQRYTWITHRLRAAVEAGGHLELVKWFLRSALSCASNEFEEEQAKEQIGRALASSVFIGGDVACLEYLQSQDSLQLDRALQSSQADMLSMCAARFGNLAILEWLHTHMPVTERGQSTFSTHTCNLAAENGHLKVVEWLHRHRTEGCTAWGLSHSAANGHLRVVRFVHETMGRACHPSTVAVATKKSLANVVPVVEYLLANIRQCRVSSTALLSAALADNRRIDLLRLLARRADSTTWDKVMRHSRLSTHGSEEALGLLRALRAEFCPEST